MGRFNRCMKITTLDKLAMGIIWKEIRKQAIKGSGIHIAPIIDQKGRMEIMADIERFGKRFGIGREIKDIKYKTYKDFRKEIKETIKVLTKTLLNTKNATKKELIKTRAL